MIDYIDLGATLFIPAIHKDLDKIICEKKYPNLKSVLIDTEDSIAEEQVAYAMECLQNLLNKYKKDKLLVFVRPRNTTHLEEILKYTNIEKIDGFILPKFSLKSAKSYINILDDTQHYFMPSIEGEELFDSSKLREIRDVLLPFAQRIILIRFGLEDMLRQLKMRRSYENSVFDINVTASVMGDFLAVFKSAGFGVSGGVYPFYKNIDGFQKDVKRDLKEGLFSKTIIHPSQIDITNKIYRVSQSQYDEAMYIANLKDSIGSYEDKMIEQVTMLPYAKDILKRAKVYGIFE